MARDRISEAREKMKLRLLLLPFLAPVLLLGLAMTVLGETEHKNAERCQ